MADSLETPGKDGLVVTLDAVPGVEIWLAWGEVPSHEHRAKAEVGPALSAQELGNLPGPSVCRTHWTDVSSQQHAWCLEQVQPRSAK